MFLRNAKGFTLPEILVTSALLCLLLTMSVSFLVPGLRAYVRGQRHAELLRMGHLALDQITRDLRLCPAAVLTCRPHEQGVTLCGRVRAGWTPDGTSYLADSAFLYRHAAAENRLLSARPRAVDVLNPFPAGRLTAQQVEIVSAKVAWQPLCSAVKRFAFEHAGTASDKPQGPYRLQLELLLEGSALNLRQTVQPRQAR